MTNNFLNKKLIDNTNEQIKKYQTLFQSISFYIDNHIYSVDLMNVMEIIIPKKIFKVPNTPSILLGVLNMRGNILPIYSLKLMMGFEDELKGKNFIMDEEKFIIVIKKNKDLLGLMIDGIYKNITVTEENYRTGSYLQKWSRNAIFSGVILENDNEILVLNIDNLLKYIINYK